MHWQAAKDLWRHKIWRTRRVFSARIERWGRKATDLTPLLISGHGSWVAEEGDVVFKSAFIGVLM